MEQVSFVKAIDCDPGSGDGRQPHTALLFRAPAFAKLTGGRLIVLVLVIEFERGGPLD
jgi:hypothetical protein